METQFIGLSPRARAFVATLKPVPSINHTHGNNNKIIKLGCWQGPFHNYRYFSWVTCIQEVVQVRSSGIILTCLEAQGEDGESVPIDEWVLDPLTKGRVDVEQGTYWF